MIPFQVFLDTNNLKKSQIATFLGVSNAFITQLSSGKRNLPSDKLALIKAEHPEWDTTMFLPESGNVNSEIHGSIVINGGNNKNIDNRQYYSDSPDVLRAQIELLDERIKEKDAQIKEKDAQIKQLLDILSKR